MKNMYESANSAKSAKQIFANFVKFVKSIFGSIRRSEGSVTEAEYPTNYQRISNLSLTIRPFRVAILAVLLVFVGGWNSEVWGISQTKLTVNASGEGKVSVTKSASAPAPSEYGTSSTQEYYHGLTIRETDTYYIWVQPNTGYRCTGVSNCSWNNNGYYTISFKGATLQKNATKTETATFVGNSYTISFNGNGSTSGTMSDQTGFVYGTSKQLTPNLFGRAYTVTYDANGGSCETSSAKATYTFNGWRSSNGTSYADKASVSTFSPTPAHAETVTLTAQWTNASVTLPNATKDGAVLDGWYSGNTRIGEAGGTYTPTASVTLRANWVDKFDPVMTGANTMLSVDGQQANAFTFNHVDNPTPQITVTSIDPINNGNGKVIEYDAANNKIIAHNAGTATIYFTQAETSTIKSGTSATYTYTVTKLTTSFTGSAYTLKVDDTQTANYSYTNTSAAQPTANSNDDFYYTIDEVSFANEALNNGTNLVTFNPANKQITACNAGTAKISLHQKETYKYTGATTSFNVAVTKHSNTIYVKGNANYSNSIYVDSYDNGLTLTADNTDYTNCPITNTQTAGSDVATFYQNVEVVYSSYKLGTATWTLSQPENYKYQAGNGSFTVNVIQQSAEDCYLLNEPSQYRLGKYGTQSQTYSWFGRGAVLSFKMWKHSNANDIGNKVYIYDASGKQLQSEDYSIGSMSTSETSYTITLNADARSVKFQNGGGTWASASTLDTYIKDIKVSRATWLNIATDSGNNGTLTINKKSDNSLINPGQTGVANSKIYWSCVDGGDLKIVCENPHFSFSQNTITNTACNNGTTDITVSYTNTEPGTETATVTVYNKMYRQTFTVKGVIEKADQLIAWHNDILRLGQSYTDVATANTLVTYESADESIIRVDEDGEGHKTILTAVGTGTVNITATAEESSFYAEKSSTKGIKVTEKQIQWIDWNQSLFGLKRGGANVTMNAVAASDVEDCVSSRLIEYSSNNESVVKVVNNNQLQIIGVGTAIITAVQAGGFDTDGHDYERAETEKTVIVRDPNAPCESFAYQQGQEVKMDCGWNASDKQTRISEINFNDIIPATGTLRYKGENRKVGLNYFDGTMSVEQYIPGEDWKPVTGGDLGKPSIGTYETAHLTFDRRATKMRVKVTDGLGYHYFTDCQVTQARFIETTAPVDFNLNVGQQQNQVIYLSYSNITDGLSLTLAQGANSHFSVDKSFIEGSCGSAAKNVALTITYHPTAEETNVQDVLTITDGTTTCQVVLTGSATRVNRHIIWDHTDETNIYTVQTETLSAEARTDLNELAGTVAFSLAGSSTAAGSVSAENVLSFTSSGVADVVAYTKDDPRYNVAPNVVKTFNVALTPTQIQVAPTVNAITSGDLANINEVVLNGGKAVNTINGAEVEGTFAVTSGDVINAGTNTLQLTFTPSNTDMYSGCTGTTTIVVNKAVSNIFTNASGDGEWSEPANWSHGVPTGDEPNVIISGDLIIDEELTVGNLTIKKNSRVVLTVNGDLTINGASEDLTEYGNLYVQNGGEIEVNGNLKVGDLTVEASIGTSDGTAESGQVAKAENIVYANAYIDINMDPKGTMDDTKWYGFTVPFDVDAYAGISRKEGDTYRQCVYGTHYMIAEYDANKRLNTGKGWKYITGNTLYAGTFYYFTVNGNYNTYRFKAKEAAYTQAAPATLAMNGSIYNPNANWNGVGNSTLQHAKVSFGGDNYVQVYQNGLDAYCTVAASEATFVVGCPFFIQATEASTVVLDAPTSATGSYYAPRRSSASQNGVARVNLTSVEGGYSDRIYVSGTDKEENAYIAGRDLAKAGESKVVPQLWVDAYNQKLSVHEAAWQGENAICPLGIYVPEEGEYTLTATQPEDGTQVYLTIDGMPVWNISETAYILSLGKGTMNNYGLMLLQASRMPTGVENVESADDEKAQKIILNNQLYILRDSRMYDATGKKVK